MTHHGITDTQMKYRNMKPSLARQLVGLGITQLIIGILCIIFQGFAVGIFVNENHKIHWPTYNRHLRSLDFIGHGFWTGLMVSNTLMSNMNRSSLFVRYTDFDAKCALAVSISRLVSSSVFQNNTRPISTLDTLLSHIIWYLVFIATSILFCNIHVGLCSKRNGLGTL